MQPLSLSAALLAAAPVVHAVGSAFVVNNCDSAVHLWTADTERGQLGPTKLAANGGSWSEEYYMVGDGASSNGGVSIKLTTDDVCTGPITQYEYTYSSSGDPDLWYDISNVNCKGDSCPFYSGGFLLDAPTTVDCGPLTLLCDAVYNLWNDDKATHGTESTTDLTLYLCGKDGSSSSVEVSSSAWTSSTAWTSSSVYSATPTSTYVTPTTSSAYTPSTTLATVTPAALVQAENFVEEPDNVVTEIVTEYATAVVTHWAKRSPEPQAHAHHRRAHQHQAAHPHWRK